MRPQGPQLSPTWINREHLGGPIYHYEGITDKQLRALGVKGLPGAVRGSTLRADDAVARRLKSGLINLAVHSRSTALRSRIISPAVRSFLYRPKGSGLDDIDMPMHQSACESVGHTSRAGSWSFEIHGGREHWSAQTYRLFGCDPAKRSVCNMADFMRYVHPEDHCLVLQQTAACVTEMQQIDVSYRVVINDEVKVMRSRGRPQLNLGGMVHRISGLVGSAAAMRPPQLAAKPAARSAKFDIRVDGRVAVVNLAGAISAQDISGSYRAATEQLAELPIHSFVIRLDQCVLLFGEPAMADLLAAARLAPTPLPGAIVAPSSMAALMQEHSLLSKRNGVDRYTTTRFDDAMSWARKVLGPMATIAMAAIIAFDWDGDGIYDDVGPPLPENPVAVSFIGSEHLSGFRQVRPSSERVRSAHIAPAASLSALPYSRYSS